MTNLLSEAAAAMAKAAHDRHTPEARTEKAAKAASTRWKGHGLTNDQKRILRKLVRQSEAQIPTPATPGGTRIAHAMQSLINRGIVEMTLLGWAFIRYRRGSKWRPDLLD